MWRDKGKKGDALERGESDGQYEGEGKEQVAESRKGDGNNTANKGEVAGKGSVTGGERRGGKE